MRYYLLTILLIGVIHPAVAQVLPFRTLSIEDGLSQAVVNDLLQDRNGYLWVATGYGLNRFDGIRFQNYYEEDGLLNNKVYSLFQDSHGRLWVGTGAGVNIVHDDSLVAIPELKPLQQSAVLEIYESSKGEIWFATDGMGAWRFKREGDLIQYHSGHGLAGDRVRDIVEGADGTIWFATRDGLTRLRNGILVTFTTENGLPDNKLRDLVIDKKGDLWIATRGGLSRYSRGEFRNYTEEDGLINNRIQSLSLDQKGHLWIGTEEGASYFDGANFTSYQVEQGLPNNFIYSTLYDREGNIWFGTFGGGITMFLGDHIHNYTVEEGLPNNVITSIAQGQDGIHWITSYGGGLSRFNGTSFKTYNERDGLVENKTYQVIADSKNRLLIGTRWGLSIFNGSSFRNFDEDELPYRKIRALREDKENGIYWLGTYGEGVLRFDGNKFEQFTEQDGLANNTVLGVELAENGDVWFATYGGASRYRDGSFTNITVRDGLPNNGVLDILYDREGRLWFATFNGLALYSEEEGIITAITPGDGFPNEVCYFILQDHEGIYWVGTNKGVVRFDYNTYKSLGGSDDRTSAFKLITQNQGLVANEMNAGAGFKDRDGMLWFGSVGGLTRFNPYLVELNQAPPIVHIESVRVSGETVPFGNGLEIGSDNHNLTFDFIGINLTAPDQVVYEYRLKGSGEAWQRTKQRSVRYSRLFPGEYTFQVRAHNSDGVWSTQTASIRLTILAPFWLQWWFIAAIVLGICGIIFFIYHYYKVRKMVEIERMRVRIASDLHDDVGSALTEIALQSDFLQTSEADGEVKNSLKQIGAQSRKIVSSLDDIVWSIDARNDTLGDLTDRMQDYANNVLPAKDIMYQFDGLDMEEKLTVPMKENLYLIFKEAINNIAKHSNASQVEVSLKNKNHSFDLVIRDNGSARKPERKTGHGLRNMKMRAERIRAKVEFENSSGFTVHVQGEKKIT